MNNCNDLIYAQLQQSSHTINSRCRCRCGIWECVKEHFAAGLNGQIGEHDEIINGFRFAIHFHSKDNVRISDNMRKEKMTSIIYRINVHHHQPATFLTTNHLFCISLMESFCWCNTTNRKFLMEITIRLATKSIILACSQFEILISCY